MKKFYGAHDQWTDLDKQNDVLIASTDGVIDGININGSNVPAIATKTINLYEEYSNVKTLIDNLSSESLATININIEPIVIDGLYVKIEGVKPSTTINYTNIDFYVYDKDNDGQSWISKITIFSCWYTAESRPIITIPADWIITSVSIATK